jgi:hypothetical protein
MQKRLVLQYQEGCLLQEGKIKGCVEQITAKQLREGMDHLPIGCLKTISLKSPSLPSCENLNQGESCMALIMYANQSMLLMF